MKLNQKVKNFLLLLLLLLGAVAVVFCGAYYIGYQIGCFIKELIRGFLNAN
jgi:hypothetical protein